MKKIKLLVKLAKKLTTKGRERIKEENFALPEERKYPIHDLAHAKNALVRAKQQLEAGNLTQEEYERIVSAVYAKYPGLAKRKVEREGVEGLAKQIKGSSYFDDWSKYMDRF